MGENDVNMEAEMQKLEKYSAWMAETTLGGYEYIEESPYPRELKMVICANDYHYKKQSFSG
ncbi:MAG: hypothetical protein IJJ29_07340 [Solobacterium sp.]|nr:hypothetical protein [Solobacterium sp.]